MSEPAKDEAELLDQVVVATCECHPGECYVKMGQMLCCAEEDKVEAVFAAIRAAGWAVVPVEPTEEMRRATWEAQLRHTNEKLHMELPDCRIQQALQRLIDDPKQREMDRVAYAATLAAAPGVKS